MSNDTGACWATEGGGGCRGEGVAAACDSADTGIPVPDPTSEAVIEGGPECATASPGGLWAVVVLALLSRRWKILLLLLLPRLAGAVDAQHLTVADGGAFLSLMEITRSTPWSARSSLAVMHTAKPVVLRSEREELVVLDDLRTIEGGVSLAAGSLIRLGVSTPLHTGYTLHGTPQPTIRGDMTPWITVNLSALDAPVQRGWTLAVDIPASDADLDYLGSPGSAQGTFVSTRSLDPLTIGLSAGIRMQKPTELAGMTWGSRLEGGAGVAWALSDRTGLTAELMASAPLNLDGPRGSWPAELLVSGGRSVGGKVVRAGGGIGLTPGMGSPTWRLVVAIQGDELSGSDRDGDGIPNLRDACASRPEDHDGFRDRDGCPDPDNDRDGLLDVADACPMDAEVLNGHEDTDGCPDAIATLTVTVRSTAPEQLEQVALTVNDQHREVLPGEPTAFRIVPGGRVVLEATAEGHQHLLEELPLTRGGAWSVDLTLSPIVYGTVAVTVTDPDGAPLPAQTTDGRAIAVGGSDLTYPTGQAEIAVVSEGYLPGSATVFVSARTPTAVVIPLELASVWMEGGQLRVGEIISFELDSAALTADSSAALDALAGWLRAHPEVELLRVEGTADALGSSAYNHRLSIARAEAVRQRLVDSGIAAERLEAIGSGEALTRGSAGERSVRFLVVVWSEDAGWVDAREPSP